MNAALGVAPLEAYRRDLARVPGRDHIGADDHRWVLLAHAVWTLAAAFDDAPPPPSSPPPADEADEAPAAVAGERSAWEDRLAAAIDSARMGAVEPLAALTDDVAAAMEQAGALHLASVALSAVRRVIGDRAPLWAGRVLATRARVARHLGDFESAADLYDAVGHIGRRARLPELSARAEIGRAILARIRGNYPAARSHFTRALRQAERARSRDVTRLAHEGLLITAAVAGDFSTALTHGWAAFAHAAGDPLKEADVLVNLATLCVDAGLDGAALNGFRRAAALAPAGSRTRLAATAGAAVAAARVGDRAALESCTSAVEGALAVEGTPFERAQHLMSLAEAWADAGDSRASVSYWRRGLALADAHGFAELRHQYEAPPAPRGRCALDDDRRRGLNGRGACPLTDEGLPARRAPGASAAHTRRPAAARAHYVGHFPPGFW